MKFDLHMHSYYSDGRYSPKELVQECRELGLSVIALTDHETTRGIAEAIEAGKEWGIKVIPAVELSSNYRGKEHHILGYFIDYQSKKLNDFLAKQRKNREERIRKIIDRLRRLGFSVEFKEVISLVKESVTRGHICDAIFLHQAENLVPLERYGIKTRGEFIRKLLKEDGPAHVDGRRPYIREIIDLIAEAGGISVLAHPFARGDNIRDIKEKLCILRKFGLDGLETIYPYHGEERVRGLHHLANEFSMVESAGSDFHLPDSIITGRVASFETYGIEINFPFGRCDAKG